MTSEPKSTTTGSRRPPRMLRRAIRTLGPPLAVVFAALLLMAGAAVLEQGRPLMRATRPAIIAMFYTAAEYLGDQLARYWPYILLGAVLGATLVKLEAIDARLAAFHAEWSEERRRREEEEEARVREARIAATMERYGVSEEALRAEGGTLLDILNDPDISEQAKFMTIVSDPVERERRKAESAKEAPSDPAPASESGPRV